MVKVDPSHSVERRGWAWAVKGGGVEVEPSRSVGERQGVGGGWCGSKLTPHALLESGGGGCGLVGGGGSTLTPRALLESGEDLVWVVVTLCWRAEGVGVGRGG